MEEYQYLGAGTVVRRAHPESGIDLSYIKLSGESVGDAGDQYTGLDRFGRIVDQRWLTAANGVAVDRYQYTYDRNGNRTAESNSLNSNLNETYGYDSLNQLTNYSTTGTTKSWDFDALGNWDGVTTNGTTQTRTHNRQNEITAVSGQATPVFDANGNMTTDETGKQYVYDAWNRLKIVKNSGGTTLVTYAYDPLTRRVQEVTGSTRDLYYSSQWQVIEETVGGTPRVSYVWSPVYVDAMVARDFDSDSNGSLEQRLYPTHDANFNVTALVNTSGTVVERYTYDPFGSATVRDGSWTVSSPSHSWQYLHQGGRLNAESGLYSFRYREYSPALGRWVTMDPIGFTSGSGNLYAYIASSPIMFVDPFGLKSTLICSSVAGSFSPFRHCSLRFECGNIIRYIDGTGTLIGLMPPDGHTDHITYGEIQNPYPSGSSEYSLTENEKDCNKTLKCLIAAVKEIKQKRYDPVSQNSNTYIHAILQACDIKFDCFTKTRLVPYCKDMLREEKTEVCAPENAPGWSWVNNYKQEIDDFKMFGVVLNRHNNYPRRHYDYDPVIIN